MNYEVNGGSDGTMQQANNAAEQNSSSQNVSSWGHTEHSGHSPASMQQSPAVPLIDLKSVRKRLGLSQAQFAIRFGFSAASVRNWEQGRTKPDGAARVLLLVIAKHPDAVVDALKS